METAERLQEQAREQVARAEQVAASSVFARARNHFGEVFEDSVRRRKA
jgi:hypothetical protein